MNDNSEWARKTASIIINNSLYTRGDGDPFFFSSGWASPVFIDCKKLISVPEARNTLVQMSLECLSKYKTKISAIAGCELTGVPFATLIADRLGLPLTIVCKQSKGFGRLAQFEGEFDVDTGFVLIDDLATDGISEAFYAAALCRAQATVIKTFVLINYAIFPKAQHLLSLATLTDVIAVAESVNYFNEHELNEIQKFTKNAAGWSKLHGGIEKIEE